MIPIDEGSGTSSVVGFNVRKGRDFLSVIWVDVPLMSISSSMVRDFKDAPNFLPTYARSARLHREGLFTDGIPGLYQLFPAELLKNGRAST